MVFIFVARQEKKGGNKAATTNQQQIVEETEMYVSYQLLSLSFSLCYGYIFTHPFKIITTLFGNELCHSCFYVQHLIQVFISKPYKYAILVFCF